MKPAFAILLLAVCVLISGCASRPLPEIPSFPAQAFHVKQPFYIVCADQADITRIAVEYGMPANTMAAYINIDGTRILYVPWSGYVDVNGKPIPDFDSLGHEVWHLPELGGQWHK